MTGSSRTAQKILCLWALMFLWILLLLQVQAARGEEDTLPPKETPTMEHGLPSPTSPIAQDLSYRIAPGDELDIVVWGDPQLNRRVTVLSDGHVSFPFVGYLKVADQTVPEVTEALATGLSLYYDRPNVVVSVTPSVPPQVHVQGEVRIPGSKAYRPDLRLTDYIGQAGGLTPRANPRLTLIRPRPEGPSMTNVNLDDLENNDTSAANPVLLPGDVIIVEEAQKVSVVGALVKPGAFDFVPGYRVTDYLGLAGGPIEAANERQAQLTRASKSQPVDLRRLLKKPQDPGNIILEPGDVLYVPQRFLSGGLETGQIFDSVLRFLSVFLVFG